MRLFITTLVVAGLSAFALPARHPITPREISVRQVSGTHTGQGTYFGTGLGSCGHVNSDTDYIVAVSKELYDHYPGYLDKGNPNDNPICGKKITARYKGKTVHVTVADRCEACAYYDLDFTPTAFSQLADLSLGRIYGMTWSYDQNGTSEKHGTKKNGTCVN